MGQEHAVDIRFTAILAGTMSKPVVEATPDIIPFLPFTLVGWISVKPKRPLQQPA